MQPSAAVKGFLRSARDTLNPLLRLGLGNVPRGRWPGLAMNVVGSGAPIMVGRGETVFICGVFQQSTVVDFARTVGPRGRVVVVEANPKNAARLQAAFLQPNVAVINRAVWNEDEELEFEFAEDSEAQHYNRVRDTTLQPFPTHMVEKHDTVRVLGERLTTTMDQLGITQVDHLNLTINGAELAAFEGTQGEELARRVSRVYAHTEFPSPGGEFVSRLGDLGYGTRLSGKLNTLNPAIDLRRLYAWSS